MSEEHRVLTIAAEASGVVGTIAGIVMGIIALTSGGSGTSAPQANPSGAWSSVIPQSILGNSTSARVTPMRLNDPNFNGFCQATGQGIAYVNPSSDNAYGWRCSAENATGDDPEAVCIWSNGGTTKITDRIADFGNPSSWECWASNGELGPLNWNTYCRDLGHGQARSNGLNNVYMWTCSGFSGVLDAQDACQMLYGSSPPISRYQNYYDPNSWQCWG